MTETEWQKAVSWWLLARAQRDDRHGAYGWRGTAARVACLDRIRPHLPAAALDWLAVASRWLDQEARSEPTDRATVRAEDRAVGGLVDAHARAATPEARALFAAAHDTFMASPDGTLGDPWDAAYQTETAAHGVLIRDIFGNPLRPVVFDPDWQTATAVALARTMYEARDFAAMSVLADALEDAGCDHPDVLAHCRDPEQVHVRGCWVVDLVLVS